jgi:thioredoxin reductase
VEETPVRELRHHAGQLSHVALTDDRQVPLAALYLRPGMEQHCLLPRNLGCAYTEAGYLQVDSLQRTSVPGIYAAGDATMPMRALSMAMAGGTMAGAALTHEMLLPL